MEEDSSSECSFYCDSNTGDDIPFTTQESDLKVDTTNGHVAKLKSTIVSNLHAMQKQLGQTYSKKELSDIVNKLIDNQLQKQLSNRKNKKTYRSNEEEDEVETLVGPLNYHSCKHYCD